MTDLEWAYRELKDPELRVAYAQRSRVARGVRNVALTSNAEVRRDSVLSRRRSLISVGVSTGLFVGMVAAVGYGLYFVGAVRRPAGVGQMMEAAPTPVEHKPTGQVSDKPTEYEANTLGHTATVEALHATATRGALLDYTAGLTATVEAARTALTPTPVELRACPNVASVNVRTGPATAFRAIGYILDGDCVTLSGRSNDGDWVVITDAPRPSSDGGWIAVSVMTIEGNLNELTEMEVD
ncbi:MAG TPA: SH3 domain-containing protein [Anaerolineales bacterium]|nr:SH3 domain-containing protein [Anaerolineales bacterium]